ncbi:MAG: DUF4129 domain-containing protein [bacterium]|nr:DUF4129 domain-containing protein [bacterium]
MHAVAQYILARSSGATTCAIALWRLAAYAAWAVAICATTFLQATTSFAQDAPFEQFENKSQYPWIDSNTGDLVAPELKPANEPINDPIDPGNRNSDWIAQPTTQTTAPGAGSELFSTLLQVVAFSLLGLLVVVIVVVFFWAFFRSSSEGESVLPPHESEVGDAARLEALPEPLRREESDLLGAARRCYEQGDYGEAIVYLFSYQLVELDRKQVIRLARGKTNRQYLRESKSRPNLASILAVTTETFEDAFFGRYDIDRPRFDRCWQDLERFEAELQAT